MTKLKDFKGKIIKVVRTSGPEYANDFLFPDGVRKEIAYIDSKDDCHANYIVGMCNDNSVCYCGGMMGFFESDIKKNYNIKEITEPTEEELAAYVNEVKKFFNSVLKEKGRPPFAMFPLPIIDRVPMDEFWKDALLREQNNNV